MNKNKTNILIGIPIFVGLILLFLKGFNQYFFENENLKNELYLKIDEEYKLFVIDGFTGDIDKIGYRDLKMISEKPNQDTIRKIIQTLDWEKFNAVQLRNDIDEMSVSGKYNSFSSSYGDKYIEIITDKPPKTVEEMTDILIDFFNGDNTWIDEYKSSEEYKSWVQEFNK